AAFERRSAVQLDAGPNHACRRALRHTDRGHATSHHRRMDRRVATRRYPTRPRRNPRRSVRGSIFEGDRFFRSGRSPGRGQGIDDRRPRSVFEIAAEHDAVVAYAWRAQPGGSAGGRVFGGGNRYDPGVEKSSRIGHSTLARKPRELRELPWLVPDQVSDWHRLV